MRVGIAQMAPVFLDREATLEKVAAWVAEAGRAGCKVVAFGESLVPGYPFWIERTDGARFDAPYQKALYARYVEQAVVVGDGHLEGVRRAAAKAGVMVVLGVIERDRRRGHSVYASAVVIGGEGEGAGRVLSVHRKLVPTYEERLVWAPGDGEGLVTHRVGPFTLGALNCWENWMPLARAALQGQGEDLHVAIWPGSCGLTREITRFAAREGRSYVVSAGGVLRHSDLPADLAGDPRLGAAGEVFQEGGSAIAGPDGRWIVEPRGGGEEALITADLDVASVSRERQNFDPAGHYSRPDVLKLVIHGSRQGGPERVE